MFRECLEFVQRFSVKLLENTMAIFKTCIQKERSDGNYLVYIRISHNRQVGYLNTGLLVARKEVKKGEVINPVINKKCANKIADFVERCNKVGITNWTVKQIIAYLSKEEINISFSRYCRLFTRRMDNEGRESTSQNYKVAIHKLEEFSGKDDLAFSDVTSQLINRWIESLKETKKAKNGYPKSIKTMFDRGCEEYNDYDNDILLITNQPFRKVKIPSQSKPEQRAVDVDVLREFFNTDIEQLRPPKGGWTTRAERAKDVCLLILCLAGINTADLYDLKQQDLVGNKLCYCRKKTRNRRDNHAYMEINVPDIIKPLFLKYKGRKRLFSFCEIYANQKNFNKCINEGMSDIRDCYEQSHGKQLEYMTTYTMRCSWATIAHNNCGASIELVAFSLNHSSSYKVTEGYIKTDYSPISKLNQKVVDFIFNANNI